MKVFKHSGDIGDIIYALPTIKALGGGVINLVHGIGTREPMTVQKASSIRTLLIQQPYIHGVDYMGKFNGYEEYNLDDFRDYLYKDRKTVSLAEAYLRKYNLDINLLKEPWLESRTMQVAPVIFNRTLRYQNPRFPWKKYVDQHPLAMFVGTDFEYHRFTQTHGKVSYCRTRTLGDLAGVINGSELFIGNQSCSLAIAIGLGKAAIVEEYAKAPNCRIPRDNVEYI